MKSFNIIGANVYVEGASYGSSTNQSGYYVIPKIPAGSYKIIVDYLGYIQAVNQITIKNGDRKKLDVYLEEDILQAETIVVVADSIPTIQKLYNKPISEIHLNAKQIQQIPQVAEADLMRSLQTLPGIMPVSDFSSELYVRGGTPDQNLYLLDGTDVYNPEHAFGFFSTFNTSPILMEIGKNLKDLLLSVYFLQGQLYKCRSANSVPYPVQSEELILIRPLQIILTMYLIIIFMMAISKASLNSVIGIN
ncbi:MAG: TonB-dependent receptor [Calditrichaceae bacterium]